MHWDITSIDWVEIGFATLDSLYMVLAALPFTLLIGLPLGIIMFLTAQGGLLKKLWLYNILSQIVNALRSMPFLILMVAVIPLSATVMGDVIGIRGVVLPLIIGAAPFFARLVEIALREVDRGIIEAMQSLGATLWQIIYKGLLPEAFPGIVASITVTAITLLAYSALSGALGGGGLGELAIRYGYYRYETAVMVVTIVILAIMVAIIQELGDWLVRVVSH
ncbi:MAG: ABC transporter permease [Neisseriales bacterium]|nr:MAG: ABC transporter permease [Neisseriales bacterium]